MKWGSRYGSEFVNRLHDSIKRHTKRKTRLYCFTDNDKGIDNGVIDSLNACLSRHERQVVVQHGISRLSQKAKWGQVRYRPLSAPMCDCHAPRLWLRAW